MRSFNDWYFDLFESGNGSCLNQQEIAQEAWDYQQSKVDEMQKRLQKLFDNWNCGGMNLFDLLDALEQAIKGGDE